MNARFVVPRRGRGVSAVVTLLLAMALAFAVVQSPAQPPSTVQPEGLRQNTPAVHALVNARLVLFP